MATRITGASLDPILTRLNGVDNYHPLNADTFSDWSIEAGDLVTVSRNGVNYKSPVHTSTMTWKGTTPQVQIRSSGKESRDAVSIASRKKYGKGSGAMLNSQQAYRDITTSYNNMKAGLILASSSAALYVEDMYNQMKSGLDLTSSSASLYVEDRYNQMKAGLDLTSSSASLYVEDRYNQMKSGLDLTSSSAALYVDSKYNQMKSGLDVTMSSATLYAQSRTTRAAIVARINADGEGEALIEADKVSITGSTTINSVFKVEDDGIIVKKSSVFQGNMLLQTAGSKLKIGSSASLEFLGTTAYSIDNTSIGTTIKDASVSQDGKTLTLTRYNGNTVTFNKAATPTLSGSWSGGTITVTSNPSAAQNIVRTLSAGTTSWSGNIATVPINALYGSQQQYSESTGWNVYVNASSVYTNGWNACYDTLDTSGTSATGTLSYGGSAVVSVKQKNSSGTVVTRLTRTYTAPADRYNTGYNDGLGAAWINYVASGVSKTYQGTVAAGRYIYPGTSGNMWWTAAPWFAYSDTQGSNHQGILGGHKYIKLVTLDANGAVSDSMYGNATWEIPSGSTDTYTKYTFSKTRTESSDGYHYTFAIGTGRQTPFGASGGTYDLYKKN